MHALNIIQSLVRRVSGFTGETGSHSRTGVCVIVFVRLIVYITGVVARLNEVNNCVVAQGEIQHNVSETWKAPCPVRAVWWW